MTSAETPIFAPPPAGGRIELRELSQGLEVRMPRPRGGRRWRRAAAIIASQLFWISGALFLLGVVAWILMLEFPDRAAGGLVCVGMLLLGVLRFSVDPLVAAWALFWGWRERIVLSAERIDFRLGGIGYDAGPSLRSPLEWIWAELQGEDSIVVHGRWNRSDVLSIMALHGPPDGPRVRLYDHRQQAELAWQLDPAEGAWLLELLQRWRDGDLAP